MEIGVINSLRPERFDDIFGRVRQFGLKTCQLGSWNPDLWTDDLAAKVREQSAASGVYVAAFWSGVPGPAKWNFTEGPVTLGLVPAAFRDIRVAALKKGADFARKIGAPAIITHCGFIPENMTDPEFPAVVAAIRDVALYCKSQGVGFWFETGQETPVTLLRVIERAGVDNLGINLDAGNLILYGKGNPLDALDVFGAYVRNLHVKDGFYPTNGDALGKEAQVGKGKARFPELIRRLKEIGFNGELIIEREIHEGEEQNRDIRETVENLKRWWNAA